MPLPCISHHHLRLLATLLATVCVAPRSDAQSGRAPGRPPNIVFILADDLGYGDVGAYGQTKIETPRLDEMAREGMRFTQHYSGSTVCAPARSVLMTGQHTGHTRVRNNARIPLRAEDVTVAEVLKRAGYHTGVIGKWGLGEPETAGVPNAQGFDYFYGYLNQAHAHSYFTDYLWRNRERMVLEGNRDNGGKQYTHDLFTQEALSFLERNHAQPFFLYLAYTIPHKKLELPGGDSMQAAYARRYPENEATFAAMISRLDRDVGRVLDKLKELGLADHTLVLFTSDNGPHNQEHDPEFFNSNGPLRGIKRDLYEGGIRVPMIAWWPGRVQPGSSTDHPSAFWDFLPTAAEVAGVGAPDGIDGISYLATLLGRKQPQHAYLYWEYLQGGEVQQAARMRRWKGVRYGERKPIELYDLQADPSEARNLAAAHPDLVRRVRAIFEEAHTPSPSFPFPSETKASR